MNRYLFLTACIAASMPAIAQTIGDAGKPADQVNVIEPAKQKPSIKSAAIDDERFELGGFVGMISIEDFNTVSIIGLSSTFHLNDAWVIGATYGKSGAPEASFESTLDGNFVQDREAGFQYTSITGGYNLFNGRTFFGTKSKLDSYLYLDFGLDSVKFNGETQSGFVLGTTYKLVITDWLTGDIRMRDHIVNRSFLGEEKLTQNIEFTLGLNALF